MCTGGRQLDHLESGTDFESRFLQKAKKQSHPDNYSYQGIYLAAPNGVLMAGSHEAVHDMKKIEKILRRGWKNGRNCRQKTGFCPRKRSTKPSPNGAIAGDEGKINILRTAWFSVCSAGTCPAVRVRIPATRTHGIRISRGFARTRPSSLCPPS